MKIKTDYFLLIINPLFFAVITLLFTLSVESSVITALVSSILHELGHLILLIKFKNKIKSVTLSFYGMKIIRENEIALDFKKELAVCLAGVTVNIVLSVISAIIYIFIESTIILKISVINLIIGLFNVLPVGNLDGARALRCILENRYDISKSERILKTVSVCLSIIVICFGVYILILCENFTLLICSIYLFFNSFSLSD